MSKILALAKLRNEDEKVRSARHLATGHELRGKMMASKWFARQHESLQSLYLQFPPWGFYQTRDDKLPVRYHTIVTASDGNTVFLGYICHRRVVIPAVINVRHMEPVQYWSQKQLDLIELLETPSIFLEPDHYMLSLAHTYA